MTLLKMKFFRFRWHLLACGLTFCFGQASSLAAKNNYACSAPTFSIIQVTYDPFASVATLTGTATLSCSKDPNDPGSMPYSLSINSGLNSSGGNSYASTGSDTVRYDLLRSASSGDPWSAAAISGTMTSWTSNRGTASVNFYMQIPVGQTSAYTAAGQFYTDTRIVTPSYPNSSGTLTSNPASNGSLSIAIGIPANCILSSPPKDIQFTYTSFQTTANQPSTSFGVKCVKNTQYTMALDAGSGKILGLDYTLTLNRTTQTGTSAAQNVSITGNMAAGQSGRCTSSCSDTQTRTLTISY